MLDIPEFDMNPFFEQTWQFMESAIGSGGGVLVHCNAGISRSSTLVIAYLIKYHKMKYDDAYQLVKVARPAILPNGGFQLTLRQLEKMILSQNS
jgi:dual specificity protein phosphatase 1B